MKSIFFDIEDVVDNASIVVHFEGQENAKKAQEHEKAAKRRKIEDKTQIQVEFSLGKARKKFCSKKIIKIHFTVPVY